MARQRPSRSRSRRWRLAQSPTLPEYSPRQPTWIIRTTRLQWRPLCWCRRRRLHSDLSPFPICRQKCRWVHVWARTQNEAYVWGSRIVPGTSDLPESFLFRWNGSDWVQILGFSGHRPGGVFGVGASDVFISVRDPVQNRSRILRSIDGGQSFTDQA